MGPSYTTRREEAKDGMTSFVQAAAADRAAGARPDCQAQDWPMADDIAKRMRATLPPKILQLEALEKQGATPEQIDQFLAQQPEPPPDPKLVKVQQDGQLAMAKMRPSSRPRWQRCDWSCAAWPRTASAPGRTDGEAAGDAGGCEYADRGGADQCGGGHWHGAEI